MEWLLSHGGAALFVDPGMGKTAMVLRTLLALKDAGMPVKALIVAPLRVATNVWPKEWEEWAGSAWARLKELKIVVLHGDQKDTRIQQDADIYVVNFDGLKWLFDDGAFKKIRELSVNILVVDESSKFRHYNTKRFKLIKKILGLFKRRWILTGSPNPNGYLDLFSQVYLIDMGKALGRYITHYRMEYFTPLDRMGWNWVLKKGADERIQKAIAPYVFRLDAEDYLKLPQENLNVIRVDLPDEARRVYEEMEQLLITEVEEDTVTAVSVGAKLIKCAQIANGGLYIPPEGEFNSRKEFMDARKWAGLHNEKGKATLDIIEELGGSPCMVVYDFAHDLVRLREYLEKELEHPVPHMKGTGENIIKDWNADKIPVLLVHAQTVSHGLNLQYGSAHHIIWHSLTYDYDAFDQLNRRLRRQGSRHDHIFVHLIVARDTVDEPKLTALRRKEKTQTNFLNALKAYAKKRS